MISDIIIFVEQREILNNKIYIFIAYIETRQKRFGSEIQKLLNRNKRRHSKRLK